MSALDQEELRVILLDTRNRVLVSPLSIRPQHQRRARGRIFRPAIEAPAAAIILVHNHPSADPSPSPEDLQVTRQVIAAGKLLDIELLDHLIIAAGGRHVSLKERRLAFD